MGEMFIFGKQEDVTELLERKKSEVVTEIDELKSQSSQYTQRLSDLKVVLYAKFGSNINLESDE